MFFIIGDIWTIITVKLIGGVLKLAWFLTRTAFYLTLFLIVSAAAGVTALIRRRSHDELAGTGEHTGDGLYWRDYPSGQLYHVHATQTEDCEVHGTERGQDLRRTTLSRLMRNPALLYCQFDAVTDSTDQVAGSARFSRHARRGIRHLDDLDPQTAGLETTDVTQPLVWAGDHESAAAALEELDSDLFRPSGPPPLRSPPAQKHRSGQRPGQCHSAPCPTASVTVSRPRSDQDRAPASGRHRSLAYAIDCIAREVPCAAPQLTRTYRGDRGKFW